MALGADQCHRLTSLWETAEQQQQLIGGNEAVGVSVGGESERGNGVKDLCEKLFAVGSMEGGEAGDFDLAMQVLTEPCSMFVTCLHLRLLVLDAGTYCVSKQYPSGGDGHGDVDSPIGRSGPRQREMCQEGQQGQRHSDKSGSID
jgi:hypothetical protein